MNTECSVSLLQAQAPRNLSFLALRCQIERMPTIDEIRRQNLTALVKELGGNKPLAERVGVSESQMAQWVNGAKESKTGKARGMRLDSCHRIEDAAGKPRGWLDQSHNAADQVGGGQKTTAAVIADLAESMSAHQQEQLLAAAEALSGSLGDRITLSFSVSGQRASAPSEAPAQAYKKLVL